MAKKKSRTTIKAEDAVPVVRFDFHFTASYRSAFVDGAVGTVSPNGQIHLTFYNERPAPPNSQTFKLKDGALADEVKQARVGGNSVMREAEINLIMTAETALDLSAFIQAQAKKAFLQRKEGHD